MRRLGNVYPNAGYGGMFRRWLCAEHPQPYGSFGNGSAMRVAAAGWLFDTLDKTLEMAKVTAEVTHNHPEAIIAFLESNSFEDALRNAVSLGGDSDTLACITGGIAEAFYGMSSELQQETLKRLPEEMRAAYELFRQNLERKV